MSSNSSASILYPKVDPSPSSREVINAVAFELAKQLPGLSVIIGAQERILAEHEAESLKLALFALEKRLSEIEKHLRTPEAVSLMYRGLQLAATDVRRNKILTYIDAVVGVVPQIASDPKKFDEALNVLEDLKSLSETDLRLLRELSHRDSVSVEDLVGARVDDAWTRIESIRSDIEALWPTAMRLQGAGLILVVPAPLTYQATLLDVGSYSDFLRHHISISASGRRLLRALGTKNSGTEGTGRSTRRP